MKITDINGLGSYGVFIDDLDFATITDEEWMEVGKLHLKKLVTIIRQPKNLTKEVHQQYIAKLGPSRHSEQPWFQKKYNLPWEKILEIVGDSRDHTILDREKEIIKMMGNVVEYIGDDTLIKIAGGYNEDGSAKGLFPEGELDWHSNEAGVLTFAPGVGLFGGEGMKGSATGFNTTVDYYENVSESFRSELDEMITIQNFAPGYVTPGLNDTQEKMLRMNQCPIPDNEMPLIITSPGGIRGLHYSIHTTTGIKGMSETESQKVFDFIKKGLFIDEYTYDHWYQDNGDLCLFDNSITQHRRLGNIEGRLGYRIQHDYTFLQDGKPWQPYSQPDIAAKYNKEIREIVEFMDIDSFILPEE